jgi:exopolysaccharide biosynthesis polyprenyl glycosylphosphotransferase
MLESVTPARLHRDILHVALLVIVDIFALYEAFVLAYGIRAADSKPFAHYMAPGHFGALAAGLTPLWVAIFGISGLYAVRQRRGRVSELGRVTMGVACGVMTLVVIDYMRATNPVFPSRSVPVYSLILGVVFVVLCRQIVRLSLSLAYTQGRGLRNVVIIGTGPLALRIANEMRQASRGYRIVAAVDAGSDGATLCGDIPVFANLDAAMTAVDGPIDEIVQADTDIDRSEIPRLMSYANSHAITYRFIPDQYGVYAAASSMSTIAGVPVMEVRLTALDGWGAVTKRAFDIVGSLLLLVVLAPVFAAIAAIVKFSDPAGPIFYRQERLGLGGKRIQVRKFRSMNWEYSTGPDRPYKSPLEAFTAMGREDLREEFERDYKVQNDPRVSTVGRVLRRTSLDELPQLINALRGDVSLIGPRPVTGEELKRYGSQRASFLALKPGITGLWQISGRNDVTYDERVKLDIFYVENWSAKLDLSILARTTTAVLAKKGAY